MYVGLGALSEAQKTEISALLPRWYSRDFEECWVKQSNMDYPHCRDLDVIYRKLNEGDRTEMDDFVDKNVQIPSEKEAITYGLIAVGAGLAIGILVATAMR